MDIYLIRHTQTATETGLCYGQTDVPLAASFEAEVQQLQHKLPKLHADTLIYSSPLKRCQQLAQQFSASIITDARLGEVNFGAWENQRFDALDPKLVKHWSNNFVHLGPPGGESFSDLCQRVDEFWQELLCVDATQVLLITHAGVIRALLAQVLQLPLANAFQFKIDVASVHKLQYLNNYTYIHYLNH